MERPFLKELVKALYDVNGDKAPGLGGFTMAPFQKCWRVVKEYIMIFSSDFHSQGALEKSMNASFIALIPKRPALNMNDFRPLDWELLQIIG